MGLDACVYCDCFERGRLRTQPRPEWRVYVGKEGYRRAATDDLYEQMAFDAWDWRTACDHEDGVLLHHYLGNIALVGLFREILNPLADRLPVIVHQVIYSGTHCGDHLPLDAVEQLAPEV